MLFIFSLKVKYLSISKLISLLLGYFYYLSLYVFVLYITYFYLLIKISCDGSTELYAGGGAGGSIFVNISSSFYCNDCSNSSVHAEGSRCGQGGPDHHKTQGGGGRIAFGCIHIIIRTL